MENIIAPNTTPVVLPDAHPNQLIFSEVIQEININTGRLRITDIRRLAPIIAKQIFRYLYLCRMRININPELA